MTLAPHIEQLLSRLCRPLGIAYSVGEIFPVEDTCQAEDSNVRELFGEERSVWSRLRSPKRRREFAAGRAAAKRALSAAPFFSAQGPVEIGRASTGAPRSPSPDIHISISHTGTVAAAVVAPFPVGIDIESNEPRPDSLLRYFFSKNEQRFLADTAPSLRTPTVNQLWTRKEAAAKVGRWGGSLPFRDVDCAGETATILGRQIVFRTDTEERFVASIAYDKDCRNG